MKPDKRAGRKARKKAGRHETSLAIAEKLIKLGYATKEIVLITDLPEKQIDQLR